MDNIIKNPTFIAVVAGVIAYTYIVWRKKQNKKKNKKNKNNKKDNSEVYIAGIVAVLTWLIVYGYLNYGSNNPNNNQFNNTNMPMPQTQQNIPTYKLIRELSESPKSFTLINQAGGIAYPMANTQMPDIFIDNI